MTDSDGDSDDENDNDSYLLSIFYGQCADQSLLGLYKFSGAAEKKKKRLFTDMEKSIPRAKAGSHGAGTWDKESIHLSRIA